jgi:hypothetical protein
MTTLTQSDEEFLAEMHNRMIGHTVVADTAIVVLSAAELDRLIKLAKPLSAARIASFMPRG